MKVSETLRIIVKLRAWDLAVLFLCVLTFIHSTMVYGTEREEFLVTQHFLEDRILKVLVGYDKNAIVFVDLSSPSKQLTLPTVPFLYDLKSLKTGTESIAQEAAVTIYTSVNPLPEDPLKLIRQIIKPYTNKTTLKILNFPKGYALDLPENEVIPEKKEAESQWGKIWDSLQNSKLMEGLSSLRESFLRWGIYGFALVFFLVCIVLFGSWRNLRKLDSIRSVLESSIGKVAAAVANIERGGSAASTAAFEHTPGRQMSYSDNESQDAVAVASLPENGLKALLSDCYWSSEDEQAAFLWRSLSMSQRKKLIDTMPQMRSYASYLANFPGVSKGFEKSPYYLDPLMTDHLSNDALSLLVKKHLNLYQALPELRCRNLDLPLKDRLLQEELRLKNSNYDIKNDEFINAALMKTPASPPRSMTSVQSLPIRSEKDELELLSWAMPSIEIMAATPTLVWGMYLHEEAIKKIVTEMPAKEIARALVGPTEVLIRMKALFPTKRLELVIGYMKLQPPQRNSSAFMDLHNLIIAALRAQIMMSAESNASAEANPGVGENSYDQSA